MKIIKITSLGCPSCIIMNDRLDQINNMLTIENLDYDLDDIEKYNVGRILPVIIFYNKSGKELIRLIGEQPVERLKEVMEMYKEL